MQSTMTTQAESDVPVKKAPARKRFVGSSSRPSKRQEGGTSEGGKRQPVRRVANLIPDDIMGDEELNEACRALPSNYSFEIHKTIHLLRRFDIQVVALQMPEGLLLYSPIISDSLQQFTYPQPLSPTSKRYKRLPQDLKDKEEQKRAEAVKGNWIGRELDVVILGDVTYGACCIDDYTAKELGCEMIVHYGHSCLIPVSQTLLRTLYVFVEIQVDTLHLALSVRRNFPSLKEAFRRSILEADAAHRPSANPEEAEGKGRISIEMERAASEISMGQTEAIDLSTPIEKKTRIALVSTIQFISALQELRETLAEPLPPLETSPTSDGDIAKSTPASLLRMKADEIGLWRGAYEIVVPQSKPLSPGEVLGCTAPRLEEGVDALIYIGDGRFHLESIMIANPTVPAFRYDPYDKKFTREGYEHEEMRGLRSEAVKVARENVGLGEVVKVDKDGQASGEVYEGCEGASGWGVVLGTLGRQGSMSVLKNIVSSLPPSPSPPYVLLLSELSPQKLDLIPSTLLNTFVQTSCPRLSIDWGYAFSRPLLTPYEANVALGRVQGWEGLELAKGDGSGKTERGKGGYPMDFYSDDSLGPWTPRHGMGRPKR